MFWRCWTSQEKPTSSATGALNDDSSDWKATSEPTSSEPSMTRRPPTHSTPAASSDRSKNGTESPTWAATAIRWRASLTRTAVPSQRPW